MCRFCSTHRARRFRHDEVASPRAALALITSHLRSPACADTVCLLLDRERRVITVFRVNDTVWADSVFEVVDAITMAAAWSGDDLDAVVIGTRRPAGGVEPEDLGRWVEACDRFEHAGVELVEWFVIGDRVTCPRDLLGEPSRWLTA